MSQEEERGKKVEVKLARSLLGLQLCALCLLLRHQGLMCICTSCFRLSSCDGEVIELLADGSEREAN